MVTLAKSDRTVARHPDDFDNDQWLCAVKNGTLDLRTGQLRSHDQKDMITKLAPSFTILRRDAELVGVPGHDHARPAEPGRFSETRSGFELTGITSDKAMFILYGPGGDNGKSTMVEVIEMLLGNYARRTPVETFLKKREGASRTTLPVSAARGLFGPPRTTAECGSPNR